MRIILDTSALIDHLTQRQPHAQSIRLLCLAAYHSELELWANAQSYFTALAELQEIAPDDQVRNALLGTLRLINVCGVNASDMKQALESNWLAVEDFVAVKSAERVQASCIVTHSPKLFPKNPIAVMTAMDLVKELNLTEEGILARVATRQAVQNEAAASDEITTDTAPVVYAKAINPAASENIASTDKHGAHVPKTAADTKAEAEADETAETETAASDETAEAAEAAPTETSEAAEATETLENAAPAKAAETTEAVASAEAAEAVGPKTEPADVPAPGVSAARSPKTPAPAGTSASSTSSASEQ